LVLGRRVDLATQLPTALDLALTLTLGLAA
jgi:hypothetical protein